MVSRKRSCTRCAPRPRAYEYVRIGGERMRDSKRAGRWFVVAAALMLMAASCGDDDNAGTSATTAAAAGTTAAATGGSAGSTASAAATTTTVAAGKYDPAGVLKIGDALASTTGGVNFDPVGKAAYSNWPYMR